MASTSYYSYGSNDHVFDVFINHRGPDTKETLAKDLYDQLKHRLRVFLDFGELKAGEEITPQIQSAIRTASVHIAIFSKRYCESSWCLEELFLMLQSGSPILPIFYGVKPSELRWGTQGENGVYAQALHTLAKQRTFDSQPRYDTSTIEKWRKALFDCAEISGFDLETFNGDERQLLQRVVERVLKIAKIPLHVSEYPTGLDEKVKDFEGRVSLQQQSSETRVIGIVGLGGVGKTTLAKEIFNSRRSNFKKSCYLSDVRETADRSSLTSLQGRLVEDLTQSNVQIGNTDDGIEKLKRYLLSSHAFIVLDDVDRVQQLHALLSPVKNVLHQGSLIIVTSRNMDVLIKWGIVESSIFKLTGLQKQHSRVLFCRHAFDQPYPVREFEQVVEQFLAFCGGLPLSLKVLGALLRGEDLKYWKAQLHRISQILPQDIQSKLKISYDCLDKFEKQIFLDIACFFIGEDRDTAIRIWDGTEWGGWLGFRNLERRCIVEVDSDNCIRMHDHMRDLGRDIAEDEHTRRLWRPTHNLPRLSENSPVRGISNVHLQGCENELTGYMSGLQLFWAEGYFVEDKFMGSIFSVAKSLIWLCWFHFPYSCIPSWIPLKTLRVLRIRGSELQSLWLNESHAPTQLRELYIQCNSFLKFPESISKLKHLEKLELLGNDLIVSSLDELCHLQSLKHLALMRCSFKTLPDSFGNLTNLEYMRLKNHNILQRLPDSFGNLTHVTYIDLSFCDSLQMLPDSFGNLTNVTDVNLAFCSSLQMLPDSFGNLTNLHRLRLRGCSSLQMLPDSFGNLTNVTDVHLSGCSSLQMLPDSFGNLTNVTDVHLSGCSSRSSLQMLPDSFGNLTNVTYVDLSGCSSLQMLPDSFGNSTNLHRLRLRGCSNLQKLPDSIGKLNRLQILDFDS